MNAIRAYLKPQPQDMLRDLAVIWLSLPVGLTWGVCVAPRAGDLAIVREGPGNMGV